MTVVRSIAHGPGRLPADRWDIIGALICLAGGAVIMYAPRSTP